MSLIHPQPFGSRVPLWWQRTSPYDVCSSVHTVHGCIVSLHQAAESTVHHIWRIAAHANVEWIQPYQERFDHLRNITFLIKVDMEFPVLSTLVLFLYAHFKNNPHDVGGPGKALPLQRSQACEPAQRHVSHSC